MSERNDGKNSRPNDWSQENDPSQQDDLGMPDDTQSSERGDIPKPVPPKQPDDGQGPGPQGARQPQGGEGDAGHTINTAPGEGTPHPETWQEGLGEQKGYHAEQTALDRPADNTAGRPNLEGSDIFAIVLSVFFPGVGQMMLGQQTKGIVVLVAALVTGCGLGLLSIASAVDTYCVAMAKKKRGVDEWEFFPDIGEIFNQTKRSIEQGR